MCAPYAEARPEGGARTEKEIGEKAEKIIRYQIVSTYFLHSAFKLLSSVFFWFDSAYLRATTEQPEELFTLYVMRVQKRKRQTFGVFRIVESETK